MEYRTLGRTVCRLFDFPPWKVMQAIMLSEMTHVTIK